MNAARERVSFSDLQQMPDDGRRYELYDGDPFVVPAPIPRHQLVAINLDQILRGYAGVRGGLSLVSPIDIVFSEWDVVQPDVVYFTEARRHLIDFDAATRHRPDLVVEVLSPGTTANDRGRKMNLFARYGVPEYWIVDTVDACLEVHLLDSGSCRLLQSACGEDIVQSAHLPELSFPASAVFSMP